MTSSQLNSISRELATLVGSDGVVDPATPRYLHDGTESRRISGRADAIVRPADVDGVASIVRWCYEHDVPIVPRGGGTGFAGGAVPLNGGVVVSLERLRAVRRLDAGFWRAEVEAGVPTADLRRRARENGLLFRPIQAPLSSPRSVGMWLRMRVGRTLSSTALPAHG